MRVTSAKFIKSALRPQDFPRDGRPEIAFVGRSNVGKSTTLNALLKRRGLAQVSNTPGKTRTLNFFEVNGKLYFVDLPGYGFAKVPKAMKEQWVKELTGYLKDRPPLKLVCALIDSRHPPTAQDHEMLELLETAGVPTLILATKIDKLSRSERPANLQRIRDDFDLPEEAEIVPFSGVTGEGVPAVLDIIGSLLA